MKLGEDAGRSEGVQAKRGGCSARQPPNVSVPGETNVPTYDYRCQECDHEFRVIESISSHEAAEPPVFGVQELEGRARLHGHQREDLEEELRGGGGMRRDLPEWELDLQNKDGEPYMGEIVANLIAEGFTGEQVFVTDDGRLIVYDPSHYEHWDYGVLGEADEDEVGEALEGMFDRTEFIRVMSLLGMQAAGS